jgi:hypothetical protein
MPKKGSGKPFLEWCAENGKRGERLANEFREELPTKLTYGSRLEAKWKCLKCKHVWRATMNSRTSSDRPTGCPQCKCNAPASKTKNFLTWCEKNGERGEKLSREYVDKDTPPTELKKGSHYKAKWKCLKCKHVWRAQVRDRTKSVRFTGCPKCSHNAPATKTKNFLAWCEENGERGKKLSREYVDKDKPPTAVTHGSHYKAKWKCSNVKCSHVWRAQVSNRTKSDRPTACPACRARKSADDERAG